MKKTLILLLVLALLLGGCSLRKEPAGEAPEQEASDSLPAEETAAPEPEETGEPEPEPSEEPEETGEPEPEPTETPEPEDSAIRNPLSGEPLDEPLSTRPFAAMLNNISVALPQCGISQADILYEFLVEGGITRFMGVFSEIGDVEKLGSMRSLRPYYLSTALSYDAVMVHAGGSEDAYSDVATKHADNIDGVRGAYGGSTFYRDPNRMSAGVEHSLFTSGEMILSGMELYGYRSELKEGFDMGLSFTQSPAPQDWSEAGQFVINFGTKTTSAVYDAQDDVYTLSQYGGPLIDGNTGESAAFKNIVVLYTDVRSYDDYGRLKVNMVGGGSGALYRGGRWTGISWSREAEGEPFLYTFEDGSAAQLGVGHTFIAVLPVDGNVSIG